MEEAEFAVVGFEKGEARGRRQGASGGGQNHNVFCHRHVGFTAPYREPTLLARCTGRPYPGPIYLAGPIVMSIEARSPLFAVATANGGKMT